MIPVLTYISSGHSQLTHFCWWQHIFQIEFLMVNFYYKSNTNFTFPASGYIIHVKYSKSLLKILDLQNGVFPMLDGADA